MSRRQSGRDETLGHTYAPGAQPPTSAPQPFQGRLSVTVLEAEELQHNGANVRPFVRVTVGQASFETSVAMGSLIHMWRNQTFVYPIDGPCKVRCQVFHKPPENNSEPTLIGGTCFFLDKKNERGQKWFKIASDTTSLDQSAATNGNLKLRWDFVSRRSSKGDDEIPGPRRVSIASERINGAASVTMHPSNLAPPIIDLPSDGTHIYGTLKLEIIRAKGLVMPEYWISFSPYVVLEYKGTEYETKIQRSTTNPFYNHQIETAVINDEPLVFRIYDPDDGATGTGKRRQYGVCGYSFDITVDHKQPSIILDILDNLDDAAPASNKGQLHIKMTYKASKPKVQSDTITPTSKQSHNGLIELTYLPTINGSVSIVPEDCQYVWFNMYDDSKFKNQLEQKIIESYMADKIKSASPGRLRPARLTSSEKAKDQTSPTMDSVIVGEWKCERLRHLLDMMRVCAESLAEGLALPVPEKELNEKRVRLLEMSVMREQVARESAAIRSALRTLWCLFATGSVSPTPEEVANEEDFEAPHFKAVVYHTVLTFANGISQELARIFAETEWNEEGSSGRDRDGKLLLKDERFEAQVSALACFWCDTLTEYEILQFLHVITPVIQASRKTALKWKKLGRKKSKREKVKDTFKHPEHLDQLGHRIRPKTSPSAPSNSGESRVSRRRRSSGKSSVSSQGADDDGASLQQTKSLDKLTNTGDSSGLNQSSISRTPSSMRKRSTLRPGRRQSLGASTKSLNASRKKKKTPFEVAEAKVRKAFEMEDMDWDKVAKWAKDVFGGFGEEAANLLKLSTSEIDAIILRLYPDVYTQKHPKIRADLQQAVATFFDEIKPKSPEQDPLGEKVGSAGVPEGLLKKAFAFCHITALKKCMLVNQQFATLARPFHTEQARLYPEKTPDWFEHQIATIFTPLHCQDLRQQVGMGKLKSPSKTAQAIAEMACSIVGHETNGYWSKFRELICKPDSHSIFAKFNFSKLTPERFNACLKVKENFDSGIDRQGRQLSETMRGISWITMTEETATKNSTLELGTLFKWVKLVMEYFSIYAGKGIHREKYGWVTTVNRIYWD